MSVLIKGMKMPNSCVECPLYKESVCDAFETLAPYTFKDNERALFCPLTEVAEPKTGKWIPVSERLPENSGCVLISIAGDIEFGAYDRQNSDWAIWRDGYWDEGKRADAWMPLPEPWKDGEA